MLQKSKTQPYVPFLTPVHATALKYWPVLLLIALPLLITLINPSWIYNPEALNNVDTWIYHGLFRHFFDFATTSPSNTHYFIERLSWVLPGYVLYKLFVPVVANAILHLSVYYIALFAIYGTARHLFGKTPAFIAALCLGSYTWFLRATGHDYLDGAGIAYFSAAIWFATVAAYRVRARWHLLGSGACLALALVTQLTWAAFIPVVAVYFLMLKRHWGTKLLIDGLWVVSGGVVVLSSFMLFNLVTLGRWNIFSKSIAFVRTTSSIGETLRADILRNYASTPATWIAFPCLVAVCAIICLGRWDRISPPLRASLRAAIVVFALMTGIFSFLHLASPFLYLYVYLYASFLIPVTFLLFAGVIAASNPSSLSSRVAFTALLLVLTPFVLITLFQSLESVRLDVVIVWLVAATSMALIAFAVLQGRNPLVIIGAFSVMSFIISGHNGVAVHDRLRAYRTFTGANTILEAIDSQLPQNSRFSDFVIWSDSGSFSNFAQALNGMSQPIGTHGTTLHSFASSIYGYEVHTDVVMLSDNSSSLEELSKTLGDSYEVTNNRTIMFPTLDNSGSFRGYILEIDRLHTYDTAIVPAGKNVLHDTAHSAWTGPGSAVILEFNLPSPTGDVVAELCGNMSIVTLDEELSAAINGIPITFRRQPATAQCELLYLAEIPQTAISGDALTELAITIPTGPADLVFHNGDMRQLGMALVSISFNTQHVP